MLILISIFHLGAKPSIRVVFHTYKSSRAEKNWAQYTMLFDMQSKHINYNSPKTKAVHLLCSIKSWHRDGGLGSYFCWKLDYPKSPSVFWHYLHKFCIAVWVVFTDQSCSVKSIIIALLSPFWHSLAHCAGLLTSSKRQNFQKINLVNFLFFTFFFHVIGKKLHQ